MDGTEQFVYFDLKTQLCLKIIRVIKEYFNLYSYYYFLYDTLDRLIKSPRSLYLTWSNINTYIPLTPYVRRGSRGISDIPPRRPRLSKFEY
jgi:hypothetical protein